MGEGEAVGDAGAGVGVDAGELDLLRDAVRTLLAAAVPPGAEGGGDGEHGDQDDRSGLWAELAGAGWLGVGLPASGRREGLGASGLAALMEEAGRHLVDAPLLSTAGLYVPLVADLAGPAAAERLLEPVVGGGRPAGLAGGGVAGGGVAGGGVVAPGSRPGQPAWDGHRLSGRCEHVLDVDRVDLVAVVAGGPDGEPVVAVVEVGAPGVAVTAAPAADRARPLGVLELDVGPGDVEVLTGDPARGLQTATLALAAELVGVADRCLDLSLEHARDRQQFGSPIGAFQAVKHRLVDDAVAVEEARSLVRAAARLLDAGEAAGPWERARVVSMAKAAAGEAAVRAATSGVQVHGALGMTWEFPLHCYLRRAWQDAAMLGGSVAHLEAVAAMELEGGRAAG